MTNLLPLPQSETPVSSDGIRLLTPEEIKSVEPIFLERGVSLPASNTSVFVGAVKDGKVVAFLVIQLMLHAEPMWIEPGHSNLFLPLVKEAEKTILQRCGPAWVYLFAPAGKVSQLAATSGMQQEPYCVYSKLVMPEAPGRPAFDLSELEVPDELRNQ
jgi:hypothetical protein